jgi:hypothetical protein
MRAVNNGQMMHRKIRKPRVTVLDAVSWIISGQNAIEPAVVTKCFWKPGFGMASSSTSLMPDENVDTTCLNDLIS